jgi:hypothetical protein
MKIFIHPHTTNDFQIKWCCPRTELMVLEGLQDIPEVELVDCESAADFVIWHHVPQNSGQKDYCLINKIDPKKLVVIDSIDENNEYFVQDFNPNNYFLYFKRSIVKTDQSGNRTPIPLLERQFPWDYGILKGFQFPKIEDNIKPIAIGVYLRPSCEFRVAVLQYMSKWAERNKQYYSIIGPVSNGSRSVDKTVYFDPIYFEYLARTKIIVSCGPFGWCGDSRGAEAIANKCVYISNELWDYMPNAPVDGEHWIKFNSLWDLDSKIQDLLLHNRKRIRITHFGYEHAMAYHTSKARMQYIINKIKVYK